MLDLGPGVIAMSKSITLEIPEAEAANFESSIDQLLRFERRLPSAVKDEDNNETI